MKVPFILVLLAWATVSVASSGGFMYVDGTQVHFSSACLNRLIECMILGNTVCKIFYYTSVPNEADFIWSSKVLTSMDKPYTYKCYVFEDTYLSTFTVFIQCNIEIIAICILDEAMKNLTHTFSIIWYSNTNCLFSEALRNHSVSCTYYGVDFEITLYEEKPKTSTLTTTSTSTINTRTTKVFLSSASISPTQEYHSHHTTDFNVTTSNSSKSIADHENEDGNKTAIIASMCVVGVVVLILCSVIGIVVRKRMNATELKKSALKRTHQHDILKYNNVEENQDHRISTNSKSKRNEGHEYSDSTIESEYAIADDNYIITADNVGESNAGNYNNIVTPKEETTNNLKADITICVDNTKDKLSTNRDSNVDYYKNSVETPINDYQRLGQEKRDLKNPYQQLLQVEQEQQPVLSDQELSPYTLAKPVLGETILQIIDVGAWADNSCDTESTNKN